MLQKYGGPGEGDMLITCATIVQSYMMLITGPMLGISSGTQAILSYNYGAKAVDRVKKAEKYILLLCLCFTTVMFILSRIVPGYFIRIFTSEPSLVSLSTWGIHVFTLLIIPLSFQYVFVDGFTAWGFPGPPCSYPCSEKGIICSLQFFCPFFSEPKARFTPSPSRTGSPLSWRLPHSSYFSASIWKSASGNELLLCQNLSLTFC